MSRTRSSSASRMAVLGLAVAMGIGACGSSDAEQARPSPVLAEWSYSGDTGPEFWGSLSPAYAECSEGQQQSPIDLTDPQAARVSNPKLDYTGDTAEAVNNGHSIELVAHPDTGTMTVGGDEYQLAQVHFHSPSEHHLNGQKFPAEMHFVHRSGDGRLAVVGVFVDEGNTNPAWQPFVDQSSLPVDPDREVPIDIDWSSLLPGNLGEVMQYPGSLTTPPCTEGVQWYVSTRPIAMGSEQIEALQSAYSDNARPVQPLGDRVVRVDQAR